MWISNATVGPRKPVQKRGRPVTNVKPSPASPANPVVVRLADATYHRDPGLDEEVLREVRHALLRDDQVGLDRYDVTTDLLDVLLLHLKDCPANKRQRCISVSVIKLYINLPKYHETLMPYCIANDIIGFLFTYFFMYFIIIIIYQ